MVALILAYSTRKMMANKALVQRFSACETMDSSMTICSDRIGTVIVNQMTIVDVYSSNKKINQLDRG